MKPMSCMVYVYNYFYVLLLSSNKAILTDMNTSALHKETNVPYGICL